MVKFCGLVVVLARIFVQVISASLLSGNTRSCGCLHREETSKKSTTHGHTVGCRETSEYTAYVSAKNRCTNPNCDRFASYGGRGIKFLFNSFEQFYAELGPKPSPQHSLGRVLDMTNYEPGYVFWQTRQEQLLARQNKRALLKWEAAREITALRFLEESWN